MYKNLCIKLIFIYFSYVFKILSKHKVLSEDVATWIVDKLKTIFKLYYTYIEIIEEIVHFLTGKFAKQKFRHIF